MKYQSPKLQMLDQKASAGCFTGSSATSSIITGRAFANCEAGGDASASNENCFSGSENSSTSSTLNCVNGPSVNADDNCSVGSQFFEVSTSCTGGGSNLADTCGSGTSN